MRLILLLLPNVLDSSLGVTLDVANTANQLSRAAGHNALFDILIVSTHRGQTHTANGLVYRRLAKLPSPSADDLVVLPGVLALDDDALSTWLVSPEVGAAVHWLRLAHARGAWIAAGCTGTFVLASSGLLDGLSATTTWWLATSFSSRFPAVRLDLEHMVVGEDRIVTAGAALAQADLMLHFRFPDLGGVLRQSSGIRCGTLFDQARGCSWHNLAPHVAKECEGVETVVASGFS